MSYTRYLAADFGRSKTGLSTVGYRLYNSSGSPIAARVTAGIGERAAGYYAASVVLPDSFIGEIRWDTGEVIPIFAAAFINPSDGEWIDEKFSTAVAAMLGTGAFAVTITVNDGTNPVENARVRLTAGLNSFIGMTNVSGQVVFSLDAATYAVVISRIDYTFTPTTLAVSGITSHTYSLTAVVLPPPLGSDDETLCRVYGYFETIDNRPLANVLVQFTLIKPDAAASERLIAGRSVKTKTNAAGKLSDRDGNPYLELQRNDLLTPAGTVYKVHAPTIFDEDQEITLASATFDLATLAL